MSDVIAAFLVGVIAGAFIAFIGLVLLIADNPPGPHWQCSTFKTYDRCDQWTRVP